MKIFGNDGFRSEFGQKFMTIEFLTAFGHGLVDYYKKRNFDTPILIGKDTRLTGSIIENLLVVILNYRGINTISCGVIPTPGLSNRLKSGEYAMGVMITASHNPFRDNGVKLYAATGFKISALEESLMEEYILKRLNKSQITSYADTAQNIQKINLSENYAEDIKKQFHKVDLNTRILIDCSNGAFSEISKVALREYTDKIVFTNDQPNGHNINLNCGALETDILLKYIQEHDFDYAIAFDGDGDRVVFIHREYGEIQSDKMIFLFFSLLCSDIPNANIVTSEICNKGLEDNVNNLGHYLIQTEVGDRIVVETAVEQSAIIGAEPSGHYFFPKNSKTMDGLVAIFHFLYLLDHYQKDFLGVVKKLIHYKRITQNLPLDSSIKIDIEAIKQYIMTHINKSEEKLILRRSMWDPVLRVYYDYKEKNNFRQFQDLIADYIKQTTS